MIIVNKCNIPINLIEKSIGVVGQWYCFSDELTSELEGVDVRCVPDDIKFPLAFRLKDSLFFLISMLNFFNKSLLASEFIEQSKNNNGNSSNKFILPLH